MTQTPPEHGEPEADGTPPVTPPVTPPATRPTPRPAFGEWASPDAQAASTGRSTPSAPPASEDRNSTLVPPIFGERTAPVAPPAYGERTAPPAPPAYGERTPPAAPPVYGERTAPAAPPAYGERTPPAAPPEYGERLTPDGPPVYAAPPAPAPPAYAAPGAETPLPPAGYAGAVASDLGAERGGYPAGAPAAPVERTGLGRVALIIAIVVFVLSCVASALVGVAAGPLVSHASSTPTFNANDLSAAERASLTGVGVIFLAQFLLGTALGLWALIQGIVATAKRRGRAYGIVAIVIAGLAPIASFIVYVIGISATMQR